MRVKPALVTVLLVLSTGCATVSDRNPVPLHLMPEASVPGMGPIRYWGDEMPKEAVEELKRKIPSMARLAESPPEHGRPVVNFLAISSGGDDGAFAAGLLVGWTQSGRRPRFEIVTGVLYVRPDADDLHRLLNTVDEPLNGLDEKALIPGAGMCVPRR